VTIAAWWDRAVVGPLRGRVGCLGPRRRFASDRAGGSIGIIGPRVLSATSMSFLRSRRPTLPQHRPAIVPASGSRGDSTGGRSTGPPFGPSPSFDVPVAP